MKIVDRGSGPPIVIIPGIQGRWEWMKPGIDAVAQRSRVITFSLCDEPTSEGHFDEGAGFWCYVEQVREALDACGIEQASICGVSYGGMIAAAFAARHPQRVASLILVSALSPSWRPDERATFYAASPWLMAPLFCLRSLRNYREIAAANNGWWRGIAAGVRHGINVLRYAFHPGRMARRVHLLSSVRIEADLAGVQVPVLLVTGEDSLDSVVPPRVTRGYLDVWPHARAVTIARTGHLGVITRPADFAAVVATFAAEHAPRAREEARPDPGSPRPDPCVVPGDVLADAIREINGPAGALEAMIEKPAGEPRAAVVFAHPLPTKGGTMHTKGVFQATKALARIGCAVLRFNFRGVGLSAGQWDEGRGELDDYRAAVDVMVAQYPGKELWAAGFSFGAYVALTVGATDPRVCALIGIAPPVNRYDFEAVKKSPKPKFIIHGEADELIPLKRVREFYAQLADPKELVEIDRANHLFEGQVSEVADAIEDLLADFSCRTQ